ncbi:argininosuccinate lyase [Trichoderma sp. SZMC 28013]
MHQYNASISYDSRLFKEDILGSIAFARANAKSGIISNDDFVEIERGLHEVLKEWEGGHFVIKSNDEDIHTANERRLGEIIGKNIAGKLHTGRSRNEQVVCDMRMWLRERIREIDSQLVAFVQRLPYAWIYMQRAQPIRLSQWLMSFGFAFMNDVERLRECLKRVNKSPLGCGALAGNVFNIDREMMAKELGLFMQHISRWAEDLIIYSTTEFGFISIANAYSTGSSLMPQKHNPDGLELLRGKAGRAFGHMSGFMMTQKGLPSTYNKDLQESWEPMLDHVKTISDSIQIANGILSTLTIRPERMLAALDPFMLATDVAERLTKLGVPFRETHHIAGRCVAKSEELGIPMNELTLEQLKAIDSRFPDDIKDIFKYETSVEAKSARGGTSRSSILEQIKVLKAMLG